jgi:KaiC/GvpD/RAD55 family RecA-like ATPase
MEDNQMISPDKIQGEVTENNNDRTFAHNKFNGINRQIQAANEVNEYCGMFRIKQVNKTLADAAMLPDPVQLYDNLLFENESLILFADTGIGKTVFAVQMATKISETHIVLYADLELTQKQFEKRYRDANGKHYNFPKNFYRLDFKPKFANDMGEISYDEYFIQSLKKAIKGTGAKVLFIDNLVKIAASDTDSARATIPIMKMLAELRDEFELTLVLLEHNKKVDNTRPIQLNDLQGSKMKANLVDSVITIGRSQQDKHLRYIKQVKVRDGELLYDTENVLLCEITNASGRLMFNTIGSASEWEHLKQQTEESKADRKQAAIEMKAKGMYNVQIAREMKVTEGAVRKWLKS